MKTDYLRNQQGGEIMEYPVINTKKTGNKIKEVCERQGIRPKDIQEYMGFSALQSVYDWFRGKNLPTVDNLYALSRLLRVSMDTLVVASDQAESGDMCELRALSGGYHQETVLQYWKLMKQAA